MIRSRFEIVAVISQNHNVFNVINVTIYIKLFSPSYLGAWNSSRADKQIAKYMYSLMVGGTEWQKVTIHYSWYSWSELTVVNANSKLRIQNDPLRRKKMLGKRATYINRSSFYYHDDLVLTFSWWRRRSVYYGNSERSLDRLVECRVIDFTLHRKEMIILEILTVRERDARVPALV